LSTPVSSTNKTDRHDITVILLKVALNTINLTKPNFENVRPFFLYRTASTDTKYPCFFFLMCVEMLRFKKFSYLRQFGNQASMGARRGRDRMVVGLTTVCAINAYHY
jgi:hypothetical protein